MNPKLLSGLTEVCIHAIKSFEFVRDNAPKYSTYDFDCTNLTEECAKEIRNKDWFKNTFNQIHQGPALYWIERTGGVDVIEVEKLFRAYSGQDKKLIRNIAAIKKYADSTTNVLYVGKVKWNLENRLVTHFGFATSPATASLQIFHWLKGSPLNLRIHVLEFEPEMAEYMGVIEYRFAKDLKPLIGKHK